MREIEERNIHLKYDVYIPWSNRRNMHMCLVHCVEAKIAGGGRALMLIQSEEGMRIVCAGVL